MTKIKDFENLEYLHVVRNDHLNPLIRKVEDVIVPTVDLLEGEMQKTFKDVTLDIPNKILKFERSVGGGLKQIELEPIMPEFSGIGVEDEAGTGPGSGIHIVQLKDAKVTRSGETANVVYDWKKIVTSNQQKLSVMKSGAGLAIPTDAIAFQGEGITVTAGAMGITTVAIPAPPSQIMASLPGTAATAIKEIVLAGDTGASHIVNDKLTITLNSGGGVAPVSIDNFKGFFETMGDLVSQVTDTVNGKSFAFVKDTTLGGKYYTPHLFVGGTWKEFKQDPALTYSGPLDPLNHGVFSIKPSEKISVDSNGQLNLDGLSTPQLPSHFKGFFTTLEELKRDVPNPVLHQDWAYVRNNDTGGLLGYRADQKGTARLWSIIAPLGSLAVVDRKVNPPNYKQAFGIYKDDNWDVDDKGLLSLKSIDTSTKVIITDPAGTATEGDITTIKFEGGKSLAEVANKEVTIHHPQRVFNYLSSWEQSHPVEDYRGSLFYDANSRTWMGCDDPKEGGGVNVKWTKVVHRGMSDEVKSLVRRVPAKAPSVDTGVYGDSGLWHFNGVSFLERDNDQLPEEFREKCGGYITTSVQDKDAPEISIPQNRIQTCTPDNNEGGTWVRRFLSTGSSGAQVGWSNWVRTSFSHKDMEAHQKDLGAHKDALKYHVVFALTGKMQGIFAQTAGGSLGGLHEANGLMLVDNYGYTNEEKDYMDPPYSGDFRISGVLAFSGYKESEKKYPAGRWQILFRKKDIGSETYGPVGQLTYNHTDESKPYPPLSFLVKDIPLKDHQEVVINLTFSDTPTLRTRHPDLYLAPTRSYLVLEDNTTLSGTLVGEAHRTLYGNLDVIGDVGIKSHHAKLDDPNSNIRVYGEKVTKLATPMVKV
ncbi:MAG: hypothetical protein ACRC6V_17150 [Bacteroidales bacterium]